MAKDGFADEVAEEVGGRDVAGVGGGAAGKLEGAVERGEVERASLACSVGDSVSVSEPEEEDEEEVKRRAWDCLGWMLLLLLSLSSSLSRSSSSQESATGGGVGLGVFFGRVLVAGLAVLRERV